MGPHATGTRWILSAFLFLLVSCSRPSSGQSVVAEIKPNSFLPSVTPLVMLKCSMTSSSPLSPTVLVMQLKKSALPDSFSAATPSSGNNSGATGDTKSSRNPEELIATVTPGSPATLHVENKENRLELEGNINQAGSMMSLHIKGPQASDAGLYVCHVSVLNSNFQLQDFTAAANLTIIDGEGSSPVLLAKEQILETQQKHLEQEELALQEDLEQALKTSSRLADRVQILEKENESLFALVQNLNNTVANLFTSEGAVRDSVTQTSGESLSDLEEKLRDANAKMNRLENVVVSALASRIRTVETETLASVRNRLKRLEDKTTAAEMEKELRKSESDTRTTGQQRNGDEKFQRVVDRLDLLEKQTLKEISSKVNHLEEDQIVRLKIRLDRVEGATVKSLVDRIEELDQMQAQNEEKIEQVRTKVQQVETDLNSLRRGGEQKSAQSTARSWSPLPLAKQKDPGSKRTAEPAARTSDRSCYVCGNLSLSQPCSMEELRSATTRSCPAGASFCVNDVYQEEHARTIYKRCVSEEKCRSLHNAHLSQDCADFSFMSRGFFDCHFCCTSDLCNLDFKPTIDLLHT